MMPSTRKAIAAVAGADPSINPAKLKAALAVLAGDGEGVQAGRDPLDRLLSRREVAGVLGLSPKAVDVYCRRGVLERVRLGASSRASGILESSLRRVLESAKAVGGAE